MTDSGGMQKEACFFQRYCITLRDETEWLELVENKVNFMAGADMDRIHHLYSSLRGRSFPVTKELYGKGNASEQILRLLT
jgi:UDP-GlcNAc3NAcA epimerase